MRNQNFNSSSASQGFESRKSTNIWPSWSRSDFKYRNSLILYSFLSMPILVFSILLLSALLSF